MKKVILSLMLLMGGQSVSASGLYISGGYGMGDPEFGYTDTTCASDDTTCYPGYATDLNGGGSGIPGWPLGNNPANGFYAKPWLAGLEQKTDYVTEGTSTHSFAIGWDLKQNPFRVEAEYKKMNFNIPGQALIINDPNGAWLGCSNGGTYNPATNTCTPVSGLTSDVIEIPDNSYEFDLTLLNDIDADATAYMANIYFELPFFKDFDPYVGYGFGVAKLDVNVDGSAYNGTDGNVGASQMIVGIEYRFDKSPVIVGAEYRKFSFDYDERGDGSPHTLDHDYFMLKLRYDFISDVF